MRTRRTKIDGVESNMDTTAVIHVAIFTPLGERGRGGIDRMMDELRNIFKLSHFANIKLTFITTRGAGSLAFAPLYLAGAIAHLIFLRVSDRVDVAHINLSSFGSTYRKLMIARVCQICQIPFVLQLHSGKFDRFFDSRRAILKREINHMFSKSRKIIVLGAFWKQVIVDRMPNCAGKITIVRNATRSAGCKPQTSDKQINILFLGRLGPEKGVPQLIESLARLRSKLNWNATIAGDGSVHRARKAIEGVGLSDRISVPGWVSTHEVDSLLRAADVLVLPSFDENFPMSVVEALAHGVAVVCTPVGALPDIIEHEKTGLFVKPGNVEELTFAINRLLDDPNLRWRLGKNGSAIHKAQLDIESCAHRLVEIWKECSARR